MDIETFTRLVRTKNKQDVVTMMRNAIGAKNLEFGLIAKEALDTRFPGWDGPSPSDSRGTPTFVRFNKQECEFATAKEAYCWLIERFIEVHPEPFNEINWETYFVGAGRSQLYFARDLKKMFHKSPHLADDHSNYRLLPNGWYINLLLSNERKFLVLCNFAGVAKLKFDVVWYWKVLG